MADFTHLKEGDKVTRMLAGVQPMPMQVVKVDDTVITCDAIGEDGTMLGIAEWTFDRLTGIEEDPYLSWGVAFGVSGSFLVEAAA